MKKKDRYLERKDREAGGRERPNEDETGVTSRGREGKSAGKEGSTAPKRVRGAPKTQKESASKTYRRHRRWNEAGASFNTDPSSDERQMRLNIVSVASKRHLFRTLRYLRDRPIERQPIAIRVKEIWTSKRYHS
ncbi:hypothetical protein TNCV_1671201 [Trichonephila clavipes]|nr:hypothetical protein TNCV_1671201 [Trichonephila clavipes]